MLVCANQSLFTNIGGKLYLPQHTQCLTPSAVTLPNTHPHKSPRSKKKKKRPSQVTGKEPGSERFWTCFRFQWTRKVWIQCVTTMPVPSPLCPFQGRHMDSGSRLSPEMDGRWECVFTGERLFLRLISWGSEGSILTSC